MRTGRHWDKCKQSLSFIAAEKLAFSLRLEAIKRNLDPKGIKVLTKKLVFETTNVCADAQVSWLEGPDDWAYKIVITNLEGVSVGSHCSYAVSFYET